MGLFGLLNSKPVMVEGIGPMTRTRGEWQGKITLASGADVPLAVVGDRSGPDPDALVLIARLKAGDPDWQPLVVGPLLDHAEPYPAEWVPAGLSAETVWSHVQPCHVRVDRDYGPLMMEIGLTTAWDIEHTLGARFEGARLVELNGSVR